MFFRRSLTAWGLGCIAVIAMGFWLFPIPGQDRFKFWQFPALLALVGALALTIALAAHGVAGAWNRIFGRRLFEGLSTGKTFARRVLEDSLQVFLILLAQGAFGAIIRGVVLAALLLTHS